MPKKLTDTPSPPKKDRKIRTAALDSLRTFLSARHIATALSTLDILKLWKGLFYALWMCDRPLPQQQLCADLAGLLWVLPTGTKNEEEANKVVVAWLRGFWATMAREWTTGIDVLRMEKFLLLVRRVLGASLVWMQARPEEEEQKGGRSSSRRQQPQKSPTKKSTRGKKRGADGEAKNGDGDKEDQEGEGEGKIARPRWNKTRVDAVLGLLADWPFRPEEESKPTTTTSTSTTTEQDDGEWMPKLLPVGLKLHALDIWVDEAEKAGLLLPSTATTTKEEETTTAAHCLSSDEVLQRLHGLVKTLHAETHAPAARKRSKESLADERLPWNQKGDDEGGDEDGEWGGLDD